MKQFFDLPTTVFEQEALRIYEILKTGVELKDSDDYGKMVVLLFEETYQNKDSAELLYQLQSLAHRLVLFGTSVCKTKKTRYIKTT